MAGIPSPGNKLSPNRNVTAPAGNGGEKWGANGGDINPMGGSKPLAATLSDGETQNNYQSDKTNTASIGQQISGASLNSQTLDTAIAAGGSVQG